MAETQNNEIKYIYYEFNYAHLNLEPYAKDKSDSSQLLKQIIVRLNSKDFPKNKKIVDRYENRTGSEKRLLVHISAPFEKEGKRVFGKIALIKNKSIFTLSSESEIVEEVEKPENKEFIELTNYCITFDPKPIIMVEFNSSGPRLNDIEYYFRQVSKDAHIAKSIKATLHLNIEYSKLTQNIENIFGVVVKVKSSDIYKSGDVEWHNAFKSLNDAAGYRDIRLELLYPRKKNVKTGKFIKNIKGLDFARNILSWLRKNQDNIDNVEDLKMTYLDGNDEIIELDFIKNKTTSVVSIPRENLNKRTEFNYAVGIEFNKYISTGETTIEPLK